MADFDFVIVNEFDCLFVDEIVSDFDLNYCLDYIDPDGAFHYKFKDRVIKNQSILCRGGYCGENPNL